jgi:acyl-CoA reductase-like NAD-dependent aldehyde dehydrogenase
MADRRIESRDPASGEVIGSYRLDSADEAKAAIAASRAAQAAWAAAPYRERSACMKRVRDYLVENADELVATICRDSGKVRIDALIGEIAPCVLSVGYYRKLGKRLLRPKLLRGRSLLTFNIRSKLWRVPYGVVGIISPWNYPFSIPFAEAVMALLAGNGVVMKVASDTLAVGAALAATFAAAGLPEGLFRYLNLPGREAGRAFIDGGIDKIFFTGSVEVGRELMSAASARLLPLVLELGGCDAAIVRADADLDRAAAGVLWAGFSNCGQSCAGIQRIFVVESAYAAFLAKLKEKTERLRVGPWTSFDSDMGCMVSKGQKDTVESQVARCVEMGATVFAKSSLDASLAKGNFLPALVLTDVTDDMPVMREEIFGPVIAVKSVASDDEAIAAANATPFGLTASVWTRDRRRARVLAMRLKAGAVTVNDHLLSQGLSETPWGGPGDSGVGRTHSELGFLEMLRPLAVVDDFLPGAKKDPWWHPYSERLYRNMKNFYEFLYARKLGSKLAAIPGLLADFIRYWSRD